MKARVFFFIPIFLPLAGAAQEGITLRNVGQPPSTVLVRASEYRVGLVGGLYVPKVLAGDERERVQAPTPIAEKNPIPFAFNPDNLPFFCKIEYGMMKGKSLPVKFRLGDVQYVDELEKKK